MTARRIFIIAALSAAGFPAAGNAVDINPGEFPEQYAVADSVRRIEQVDVTAKRAAGPVIPAQVLSGEQLRRLSAHSVSDAIRYFSGAQIKDYGGIGGMKSVNVRSMGTHHVGVFYDGIQIGNAQNGVVDLGRFSLDNMEAVSLYNGQKSNIFQSAKDYASASSVYLRARVPVFAQNRTDNFRATLKAGSFGTVIPSFLWEHRFNENMSGSANAEFTYSNGKYKFNYSKEDGYDTTEVRRNGDVRIFRVETGLWGKIIGGDWKAKIYYYNSQRGLPGASVKETPGHWKHRSRQWDDNFFAQSSFRKKISAAYSMMLSGKYAYDYLHFLADPRQDETVPKYINNIFRQQESYVTMANEFTIFDWWTAGLSTDFQYNTLDANLVDFVYPKRYTWLTAVATSVELSRFTFQTSLLYTHVTDKTERRRDAAGNKDEWTPSFILSFRPLIEQEFYIRAFYKNIFRMPTFNDNYYTELGNIHLRPEYTEQYNIGVAYDKAYPGGVLRNFGLRADFYFNKAKDKIVAYPSKVSLYRWTMMNVGSAEITGVDFSGDAAIFFGELRLMPRLSYTYQEARDYSHPGWESYGGQLGYVPWHSGSAILGADYRDWSLYYSFIYTGARYDQAANIPENRLQPWYTHDLSLSRLLNMGNCRLRLTAEVNNIFNQRYEVVRNFPMPGTNFKFIITLEL